MLTGKNAQWGSKPAYQLTSNQMEGKSEERRGGGQRNRNSKVNIRRVDRETGGAVLCGAATTTTTGAEDKEEEKEDMLGEERAKWRGSRDCWLHVQERGR